MQIDILKGKKRFKIKVIRANKFLGLMFNNVDDILFFDFNKETKQPIHSLFCKPFLAVWLDKSNKIVEYKIIKSWSFCIKPKRKFFKLIEIPLSNFKIVNFIVGKKGKV